MKQLLITTFGLGYMKPAPGTWGSMPTAAAAWLMLLFGVGPTIYYSVLLVILAVFSFACLWGGEWAEKRFHKKDPSAVVADETAGQCVALLFLPSAWFTPNEDPGMHFFRVTLLVGVAFVLFRIFDIVKPPPARGLQRLKGGVGILIDDLIAGAYAMVVMQAAARIM